MPSSNSSNPSVLGVVLGTTLVVGTLSSVGWYFYFTRSQSSKAVDRNTFEKRSSMQSSGNKLIKAPFPQPLRDMLSKCRLAYLSTVKTDLNNPSSHLSLMRFTYLYDPNDGEVIIMSTNKNTKKYEMLCQQMGVALLVHDFDKVSGENGNTSSITLNGTCRILSGADEERYRQKHLAHNPDYPQFIIGEDKAVLCIHVESARICNLDDQVTHWSVMDALETQSNGSS